MTDDRQAVLRVAFLRRLRAELREAEDALDDLHHQQLPWRDMRERLAMFLDDRSGKLRRLIPLMPD